MLDPDALQPDKDGERVRSERSPVEPARSRQWTDLMEKDFFCLARKVSPFLSRGVFFLV